MWERLLALVAHGEAQWLQHVTAGLSVTMQGEDVDDVVIVIVSSSRTMGLLPRYQRGEVKSVHCDVSRE